MFLFEKEKAERPQITIIRHELAIFDVLASSIKSGALGSTKN